MKRMKKLVPTVDGHHCCFLGHGARDWQARRFVVLLVGPNAGHRRWVADDEIVWIEVEA